MTHIEDLMYTRANVTERDELGPVRGYALFSGVQFAFTRFTPAGKSERDIGIWFELTPIVSTHGMRMRATGAFRENDEVYWTSFGSPDVVNGPESRGQFCGFLRRLCDRSTTGAHWDAFAVAHYADALVEQIRRECVQMFRARPDHSAPLTETEIGRINSWVSRLTNTNDEP